MLVRFGFNAWSIYYLDERLRIKESQDPQEISIPLEEEIKGSKKGITF